MKFGICNEIFQDWKLDDAMAFAKKAGYDAIEIAPFTIASYVTEISSSQRKEIRELAEKNQIEISGIHWVLAQTEGLHLTHPDEKIRAQTSNYFCDLVNFCGDLGGKIMVVGSPQQRNILENISHQEAWNWATEIFREPVMRAENRAVTICLEPLAPSETNFINTAAEAIRFTQQLNTPHFKIILDAKAMSSESKPIPQIIREAWPHFAHFHANDKNLKGPGFGETDFKPVAAALKEVGYKGGVSVEVFKFDDGAEIIATKSLEYLKKSFGNGIE
ncbi:MAG: sugar phosphate isomerase/epimerase [Verrucomicrobiota bacterium]|nr:sugar phosphate isomerase/epimerase [Verrucomicrobiota bacterium]